MILLLVLALLGFVAWYYFVKPLNFFARNGVQQTKPWPILGDQWAPMFKKISLGDWVLEKYNMFPKARYFGFYQFTRPILMIKDPELIKQLSVTDFDYFTDRRTFADTDPIWGNTLFTLKGQRWKDMRATLSGSFTSSKMKHIFDIINETAENFVEHFHNPCKEVVSLQMKSTYSRYSTDVIATATFGIKVDSISQPENTFYIMGKQIISTTEFFARFKISMSVIFPKVFKFFRLSVFNKEVTAYFKDIIYETIKMREEGGIVRKDMINLLLECRNGVKRKEETTTETGFASVKETSYLSNHKPKQLKKLTNDDITSQGLIFFLAGMETVSTALAFGSYELAVNPDVQQKLREEVQTTHSENDMKVTYESLLGMKYMDQVFSEILRKWPPAILYNRLCTKPYTIEPKYPDEKPFTLKVGDVLVIAVFGIHRDKQYYHNPEKFDPERFSNENKGKIVPYSFMPFGVGPRNCIGSRFAILQAKALFYHLLLHFEIVPTEKTQIPLRLSKTSLRHKAEGGIWLGLKPL